MTSYKDKDIIGILGNIPIFQGLTEADYREIIPLLKPEKYPPGVHIIREGARGDSMCIIISGAVKITKSEKRGEILLEILYAGSYFGDFSLVDNMPRSANGVSVEETELFRLQKNDFDALLAKNAAISLAFYKNCLEVTFSRFRNIIASYAFSERNLREKSSMLEDINRDLSLAKKVQSYFINRELLDHESSILPGMRHSYLYKPCIEIGGDFLNVMRFKSGLAGIIIADVMGHGITSALGTGVIKSALTVSTKERGRKPTRLLSFLNRHFLSVIPNLYATCYYALVDTGRKKISMAKAGHPHPLFWKAKKRDFVRIRCHGTGLGLVKKARFGQVEFPIEEGDRILFFTDGVIEQKNPRGGMYTEARLRKVFQNLCMRAEKKIVDGIYEDLRSFAAGRASDDDVTLLLLEF